MEARLSSAATAKQEEEEAPSCHRSSTTKPHHVTIPTTTATNGLSSTRSPPAGGIGIAIRMCRLLRDIPMAGPGTGSPDPLWSQDVPGMCQDVERPGPCMPNLQQAVCGHGRE